LANKSSACVRDMKCCSKGVRSPIELLKCKTDKTCKTDDTKTDRRIFLYMTRRRPYRRITGMKLQTNTFPVGIKNRGDRQFSTN